MKNTRAISVATISEFLLTSPIVTFVAIDPGEAYVWVEELLVSLSYQHLSREEKGLVRKYINRMTGYSRAQTNRLISKWKDTGKILREKYERHTFTKHYKREDILQLAKTDRSHNTLSGPATRIILQRQYRQRPQ